MEGYSGLGASPGLEGLSGFGGSLQVWRVPPGLEGPSGFGGSLQVWSVSPGFLSLLSPVSLLALSTFTYPIASAVS